MKTIYTTVIITNNIAAFIGTNNKGKLVCATYLNYLDWSQVGKG